MPDPTKMDRFFQIFVCFVSILPSILAQQPYEGIGTTDCNTAITSTGLFGYTCNGVQRSCQSYLTFRSQRPYNTINSISTLLGVDSAEMARINSVSVNATLDIDSMVIVPVTCSCSGQYYQFNASYVISGATTYLDIANGTFQGLSNCQAIIAQNSIAANALSIGDNIRVPLRCACPTGRQTAAGVNFLMSYLITWNQIISGISALVGVDSSAVLAANELSATSIINPFTTLLIPLRNLPTRNQLNSPQPPPPPAGGGLPLTPTGGGGGSSRTWIYVVAGVAGGVALLAGAAVLCFCFRKRGMRKKYEPATSSQSFESVIKPEKKPEGFDESQSQFFLENLSSIAQSVKVYSFEELKAATQDFSPDCSISGSVYRGIINGDLAAIKRMNGDVSEEIKLLNKINHFNVIRLSGVAFHEGCWYLVYEYASNGPLNNWIQSMNQEGKLDWNQRLQIALDIATGLNYLHRFTSPPYVHKDLNSSNVLIDQNFRAKIANFGLARSINGEGEFTQTRHIVGTKGYMAPEYIQTGLVSPKMDVYAFGVLLLEIFTGKHVSQLPETEVKHLSSASIPENERIQKLKSLMGPSLQEYFPQDIALVLFRIIESCLEKDPSNRPDMDDVSQTIASITTSTISGQWPINISENQTPLT